MLAFLHLLVEGSPPSSGSWLLSLQPRESQRLPALGKVMILQLLSATALQSSGNFLSHSSRARNQIGLTHRSMMVHALLPRRQVGGQMLQNMVPMGQG